MASGASDASAARPAYFFDRWDEFAAYAGTRHLMVFLDYDGTLAPIAPTPDTAALPERTRAALRALAASSGRSVAVVSGRSLEDIRRMVGLDGIIYVGNHGLEIDAPGMQHSASPLPPSYRELIREIGRELRHKLAGIEGALVEDKGLTVSVHYRLAAESDFDGIAKVVAAVARPSVDAGRTRIVSGKKVYEIRPAQGWHKGDMVRWLVSREHFLLHEQPVASVYIGDDVTDEDAFRALGDDGMTVFVGTPHDTAARYYLRDPDDVCRFLEKVSTIRTGGHA